MADGFKINFSSDDLSSEPSSFEALPQGDYICNVTKVELAKVKSGDNKGKPMFKLEFTVDADNGEYVNRKLWANIMLFEMNYKNGQKGNFMLAQFLKGCGFEDALKSGNVPGGPSYMGKKLIVVINKKKQDPEYGDGYRNNVVGFRAIDGANGGSSNSLLP